MMFTRTDNIKLVVPRRALEVIFDECDRYDADETGGRILGTYKSHHNILSVAVNGIIEPGPSAHRTATYFKQDGAYQERIFRLIEEREPSIEHLGNWHTHHVNGLRHLSGGDIETYRRTVEHHNHNTDFFYALLVIEKTHGKADLERYLFKNYVLRRGDPNVYEIPAGALTLTDGPLVWPSAPSVLSRTQSPVHEDEDALRTNRVYDRDIISQFYPKVGAFKSKELGIYWRGPISLVDGSELDVVVLEDDSGTARKYAVTFRNPSDMLARSTEAISKEWFMSCRAALVTTERMCNAELYEKRSSEKGGRKWMF